MFRSETIVLRVTAVLLVTVALAAGCGSSTERAREPGPLLAKAIGYEEWHKQVHEPGFGGTVSVLFATPPVEGEPLPPVRGYGSRGDSTIWTGSYLAGQAFRYAVTKDPAALESIRSSATALHHHYRATGKRGFIGRYVAPAEPPFLFENEPCVDEDDCHLITSGPYAGSYWRGNTSRDQYTGWWFGLSLAYEMVEDESLRATIREDMREVIDRLGQDSYAIIDVDGKLSRNGPRLLPEMIQGYHAAAAVAIGEQAYTSLLDKVSNRFMWLEPKAIHGPNKYFDYFGFNLSHEAYFTLLRYDPDPDRREFHRRELRDNLYRFVAGTHNVFFDYIYLSSMGIRDAAIEGDDRLSLGEFPDPPNREYPKVLPPAALDTFAVVMDKVCNALNLNDLFDFEPQTLEPRRVKDRCAHTFLWQSSPYEIACDPADGSYQDSGTDYLVAYWMGRNFGFLGPAE